MRLLPLLVGLALTTSCAPRSVSPARDTRDARAPSLTWTASAPFPSPRDHHVTFIATTARGPRLYVAGGFGDKAPLADAWVAPIAEDGSLGAWTQTTPLPFARGGSSVALAGDNVIVTG